ncbi:hypothetical protein [Roseibium sp. Sym1]|uniref:hypothetical protein n=1 Tax=Roseibium sp. Sym1 TaxID=3016006 RepID=UPI0022B2C742|nr:hypothetical protein [Roseibium sp. Sym1]
MSDTPQKPAWQTILISLIATAVFVTVAYFVWTYANIGVRSWDVTRGSLLTDLRFFVGLLAVFLVLTFLDRIVEFVKAKRSGGH